MWLGHHFHGQKVKVILQGAGAYCGSLLHSLCCIANELYHCHHHNSLHYLLHLHFLWHTLVIFNSFSAPGSSFRVVRCTTESAAGCVWISTSKWHKCAMFCYYGDITGAVTVTACCYLRIQHWSCTTKCRLILLCSWAVLSAAVLMGQRFVSGMPTTCTPGYVYFRYAAHKGFYEYTRQHFLYSDPNPIYSKEWK